jgi:predicted aminopeptidase
VADFTFTTTVEQDAALADLVAKQAEPITVEEYFAQRTTHWLTPIVAEHRVKLKEIYATEAQRVYDAASPEDKAILDALRVKYPPETP